MSTSYYRLKPPITHLTLEEGQGGHDRLRVFINHAHSGVLTMRKSETRETLLLFALEEPSVDCPIFAYWGGLKKGTVVTIQSPDIQDQDQVISAKGELFTVAQIKACEGAGREIETPVELSDHKEER